MTPMQASTTLGLATADMEPGPVEQWGQRREYGYIGGENNVVVKKLNYIISLVENLQDQRTEHATEEVLLYSFLGIFVIVVADSFVRVGGTYVR